MSSLVIVGESYPGSIGARDGKDGHHEADREDERDVEGRVGRVDGFLFRIALVFVPPLFALSLLGGRECTRLSGGCGKGS